jgi:hypothetical protein
LKGSDFPVFGKHSFTHSTISSVLLFNGHAKWPASTEVTLLLDLENNSRACVSTIVCSQNTTFNAMEVPTGFFPSLKQNFMQICSTFKSAILQVCQNHKWNNTHLNLITHFSTIKSTTAFFQAGYYSADSAYLYLVIEVGASSHSVILQSVWKPFDYTTYKTTHTCNTEPPWWLVCSVSTCCVPCPACHYSTWSQPAPGSLGTVTFLLMPLHH